MLLEFIAKPKWFFFMAIAPLFAWIANNSQRKNAVALDKTSVNLALRRTADRVLRYAGDSVSMIPRVEQTSDMTWILRFGASFQYGLLPSLLDSSLQMHGVQHAYTVNVRNCSDSVIILGFHYLDLASNQVPCGSRDMDTLGCKYVELNFTPDLQQKRPENLLFHTGLGAVYAILLGTWWYRKRKKSARADAAQEIAQESAVLETCAPEIAADTDSSVWLHLGDTRFEPMRHILEYQGKREKLTYREAKLLNVLAERPNQLIERSQILKEVWADEGIQVSRSVDMFVSRLRKKLSTDPRVRITAVHGVGYRLEVDDVV